MPQFTPWAVTNPMPNVLFDPAAVDKAVSDLQSADINRTVALGDFQLKQAIARQRMQAGADYSASLGGGGDGVLSGGGGALAPDSTPFEQKMGMAEGGATADKVNAQGFAGQYQFGAGRLADLGLYTPAEGENLKANQWRGKFNISPYNVSTLQDFLANPAAQHAAFVAHVADIDKAIADTPGAAQFDQNGLRAVAHLGGVQGMRDFVAAGGDLNRHDANGTTLKNYYTRFAAGGPAALQQAFGSVHGPAGPPGYTPPVVPGGNVTAAWVDPTTTDLPIPPVPPTGGPPAAPLNPNAGPRATAAPGLAMAPPAPVGNGDPNAPMVIPPAAEAAAADEAASSPDVAPSPIALRTGGTDVAGPGAGPDAPALANPNRLFDTGLPGIQVRAPTNTLLAPVLAAGVGAPGAAPAAPGITPPAGAAPAAVAPPGGAGGRPPVPVLPPPVSAANITAPVIVSRGLTAENIQALRLMAGDPAVPMSTIAAKEQEFRQANINQALEAQKAQSGQREAEYNRTLEKYKLDREAATTPDYQWDASLGAWVDRSRAKPPVTPPSPRMMVAPGGAVLQSIPGGGVRVVAEPDPEAIAAKAAAERLGQGVGGDVAKQLPQLAEQGRTSAQAIGNIDYGMNQIAQASAGGMNTGYFAPWLGTLGAIGKSLGGDVGARIATLTADPAAVGNIQTAQKTLAVVSSQILQQILGGAQITDAKIQHFIHAQPGIETDPAALSRVLNWARSQFVYENEMSGAAMREAAASPTGTLPLNWQARYYATHGFAPIYDPGTHEMQQPDGRGPTREPAAQPPTAPINPTARTAGTTYQTPKGAMTWTGTGWVAP
jgi:hypothetical protein